MSDQSMRETVLTVIKELTGQKNVITIPRLFIRLLGDMTSAALLSQIIYWSDRTKDPERWFYKSYAEWQDELGLSAAQVRRAVDGDKRYHKDKPTLKEVGVETKKAKIKTGGVRLHYRIDMDKFLDAILNLVNSPIVNLVDNPRPSTKLTILSTTETTTETTKDSIAPQNGAASTVTDEGELSAKANGAGMDKTPSHVLTDKPKKERPRNPVFDAVAKGSFNIVNPSQVNGKGGRIGKIVAYLKTRPDSERTIEKIEMFYRWYNQTHPGMSAPRAPDKFAEYWLEFISVGGKPKSVTEGMNFL